MSTQATTIHSTCRRESLFRNTWYGAAMERRMTGNRRQTRAKWAATCPYHCCPQTRSSQAWRIHFPDWTTKTRHNMAETRITDSDVSCTSTESVHLIQNFLVLSMKKYTAFWRKFTKKLLYSWTVSLQQLWTPKKSKGCICSLCLMRDTSTSTRLTEQDRLV